MFTDLRSMDKYKEEDLKKSQKEPRDEFGVKIIKFFYDTESGMMFSMPYKFKCTIMTSNRATTTRRIFRILLVTILSFLIPFSYTQVNAQEQLQSSQTNFVIALVGSVSGIAGAIVGVISTVYLSPRVKEKFELREKYFVPYRKWCGEFFGEMKEFNVRYIEQRSKTPLREISDIQIILDFWSIHHVMIDAYTWIGTIIKDDEMLGHELIDLIEVVEIFWHILENNYPEELQSAESAEKFNQVLKNLTVNQRQIIAMEIRYHLAEKRDKYDVELFQRILTYLKYNIPNIGGSVRIRRTRSNQK